MVSYSFYHDPSERRAEYVNELVTVFTIYILMLQTDQFIADIDQRNQVGTYMVALTCLNFTVNAVSVFITMLKGIYLSYLKCKRKRLISKKAAETTKKA